CERWRTLEVRRFVSFLRLRRYLRSLDWPAFGGADGLVRHVYPHLGVDIERIRTARGIEGTFNVCNYTDKTNRAVPHQEANGDLPRLHVIKPSYPLPLDPDFYLGRIDAAALLALGYRDARAYLDELPADGVAWSPAATRMLDPRPGAAFVQRFSGVVGGDR